LLDEISWRGVGSLLFGLVLLGLALSQLRYIRAQSAELAVTNAFGTRTAELHRVALGIRVRYGHRGMATYTVYAFDGREELELADSGSAKGAARLREKLRQALLSKQSPSDVARKAQAEVDAREALWRGHQQDAQRVVAEYYASGKWRRSGIWVVTVVVLYSLAMSAFIYFRER
jgi:hypothetical protein